jgi:hypothetical protein
VNLDPAVLAALPADAILTVQVRVGDLLDAMQKRAGGPDELSTSQAAEYIGRTPKWWRQQCEAGGIAGAYLDEVGKWRLPNAAARAYLSILSTGRAKSTRNTPRTQSIRRGPRNSAPPAPRLVALPAR